MSDRPRPKQRDVLIMVLAGTAVAAVLGSHSLLAWTGVPTGRIGAMIETPAASWDGAVGDIGMTRPYETIRTGVRAVEGRKFPASAGLND
jgi:hypothetical protein